ncbi:MAG TPA: AAA family ATPase [Streptosporangiaceae bacterium]|nr:AAA family ATPase [Streptosporangiaceae bacterium]
MTRPVLTFFNNKGGVGKTMLAYHVAWMLNELGIATIVLDLDPQANLTASFLDDDRVEELWRDPVRRTVYGALAPLFEGEGGIGDPYVEEIASNLWLVPGDLLLSGTEQELSLAWPGSLEQQVRALRVTAAFATVAQRAAEQAYADVILVDVGPNLGAVNRAAMVASDHVVIPIRPDLYSLQGLRNLGPTLDRWRQGWADIKGRTSRPDLQLPSGEMRPRGYVVLQHGTRVDRVVGAYDRWLRRVPAEYRRSVLGQSAEHAPLPAQDAHCLGMIKHYYSLAPLGQEARKPVFLLRSADGAIGAHQYAVREAYGHFEALTRRLLEVVRPAGRGTDEDGELP